LPNTGAGNYIFPVAGITAILGYAGYLLRIKRHASQR
jgi:LPXTG-motif cell wall-anchored protein